MLSEPSSPFLRTRNMKISPAVRLSMPYDHVRAMVLTLKIKDSEAIDEVNHDEVL
ncbi:hypothetical protein LCGC14_1704980, partial [marine sediment metagenome]